MLAQYPCDQRTWGADLWEQSLLAMQATRSICKIASSFIASKLCSHSSLTTNARQYSPIHHLSPQ
ncbi:hypothetical protein ELZ14_25275 [Pseudomonas brassicacearum]|nr:hypothetical protein ELZ14_25275 [Pseudomonas brassicacearum]